MPCLYIVSLSGQEISKDKPRFLAPPLWTLATRISLSSSCEERQAWMLPDQVAGVRIFP